MGPSRQTTNLGVGSSNLSGRATSQENHSIILGSENLPCRTEKSAWHLHGCVQVRCNLGIPLLLKQNRPYCFSRGFACASSLTTANLFGPSGSRKYLNAAERRRFVEAPRRMPSNIRPFCLTLRWSGARISEVLALTPAAIDIEAALRASKLSSAASAASSGRCPCRRRCFTS